MRRSTVCCIIAISAFASFAGGAVHDLSEIAPWERVSMAVAARQLS